MATPLPSTISDPLRGDARPEGNDAVAKMATGVPDPDGVEPPPPYLPDPDAEEEEAGRVSLAKYLEARALPLLHVRASSRLAPAGFADL